MGWIATTVIALLWGALAVWALATDGSLVFIIGGAALAVGFLIVAARLWGRGRGRDRRD